MLDRLNRIPRRWWNRRLLRTMPPRAPSDWRTGPPDFVGVGAQRSGSSWWYRYAIEAHPDVAGDRSQPKEFHYFDRFWDGHPPADFAEQYHRLFPRPEGKIVGEWTPRYMSDHWSLRLLRDAAPEARILVILRDPIERYRSAVAGEPRRFTFGFGRTLDAISAAVARGAYSGQLARLFELFPRDRVLVLQYERCVRDPPGEMAHTCGFLGLEPAPDPPSALIERVRPAGRKPEMPLGIKEDLVARLAGDALRTADMCPEIDLGLWPNFRHLARERRMSVSD